MMMLIVVVMMMVVVMRRELMTVTMMVWLGLKLLLLLLNRLLIVRGMASRGVAPGGRHRPCGRGGRDRAVRVVRTGLGDRVVALHRRCTVVILQVGVIDVMVPVVFTLGSPRRATSGHGSCSSSRTRLGTYGHRHRTGGTRTSHRRVVGQAFQIIVHEIDIGIVHIIMRELLLMLLHGDDR